MTGTSWPILAASCSAVAASTVVTAVTLLPSTGRPAVRPGCGRGGRRATAAVHHPRRPALLAARAVAVSRRPALTGPAAALPQRPIPRRQTRRRHRPRSPSQGGGGAGGAAPAPAPEPSPRRPPTRSSAPRPRTICQDPARAVLHPSLPPPMLRFPKHLCRLSLWVVGGRYPTPTHETAPPLLGSSEGAVGWGQLRTRGSPPRRDWPFSAFSTSEAGGANRSP